MSDSSTDATSSQSRFDELLRHGAALITTGDLAGAEPFLREAASLAPDHPVALHNLALVLYHTNRRAEAEVVLIHAAKIGALQQSMMLLAEIFEATGRHENAFRCYTAILKLKPGNYAALMKVGAYKEKIRDSAGARESYRLALEARPSDPAATLKYTKAIWLEDPETAVRLTEAALAGVGSNLDMRANVLETLICQKEWWERIRRGQMAYHATSLDELFFKYAQDHVKDFEETNLARVAANPRDANARIALGIARFCARDRFGAEALFKGVEWGNKGHILQTIRFAPEFYDALRTASMGELIKLLPPLLTVTPISPNPSGVLYLSCDFTYFRAFALPMVVSLRDRSPHTPVHVHIMDAKPEEAGFAVAFLEKLSPLTFAVSIERPGLQGASLMEQRCYYHAIRFIRFLQHLELYESPLWLMDVDALVNRDLAELFSMLKGKGAAMRVRPGRLEPWNQFNACVVGANQSEASHNYFRLIAAYIATFHHAKSLRWGIDQLAMYGVFADLEDRQQSPQLALLGEREVDYDYREDGFIWCNSGVAKFQHLKRVSQPGGMPLGDFEGNKFVAAFERYWKETQRIASEISVTL